MINEKPKRGRPASENPMTPAERQRASRAARKKERFESCPAMQIGMMLSPKASQALQMLVYYRDVSQKQIIEELLIDAYKKS